MGKRLIIKGADFSANGMKSVTYMNCVYSPLRNSDIATFPIVGTGLPITSYDRSGTIEVLADVTNSDTMFTILRGRISTDAQRLVLIKSYKANSIDEPAIDIKVQWGSGTPHGSVTITPGEQLIIIQPYSIKFNNVDVTFDLTPNHSDGVLTSIGLYSMTGQTAVCVKYKRITFKDNNGEILANYLPALDDNDAVALYETVSKTFIYPNAESGWVAE